MKTVILAGHYSIGHRITKNERATVSDAFKLDGDVAILVNDINLYRQALFYRDYGRAALIREIVRQPKCGNGDAPCIVQTEQVAVTLSIEPYDAILEHFKSERPDFAEFKERIRMEVLPCLIGARLRQHGLGEGDAQIFLESRLRNFASSRIRQRRSRGDRSWRPHLLATGLLERLLAPTSKIPTCGALLTALYEQLASRGYSRIVHFFDERHKPAIENGIAVFQQLQPHLPGPACWAVAFERHYYRDGIRRERPLPEIRPPCTTRAHDLLQE